MTSIRLWLDDERDPTDPTIQRLFGAVGDELWVTTVEAAIEVLETHGADVVSVSLDNDLGIPGSENEGFRVAQYLERRAGVDGVAPPDELKVYSANPIRRTEMAQAFANARRLGGRAGD